MLPRISSHQTIGTEPLDREAYRQRIASIREDARLGDLNASKADPPSIPRRLSLSTKSRSKPKLQSMARKLIKWAMRILLIVMLVVLVGLIWYLWGPSVEQDSAPAEVDPITNMTAKSSHLLAEPVALKWASDAQLVSLSATWAGGEQFQAGEGDWSLVYYSPVMAATALISVHSGRAAMIGTHGLTRPITLSPDNVWRIDSPAAMDQLRAAGGDDFLRSQPDATVSISLDLSRDPVWSVRLIDQMSRRVFAARVNIDSGKIVDIQQSS